MRVSAVNMLREILTGPAGRSRPWPRAGLQPAYDAVVIGGGAQAAATALFLIRNHGLAKVALIAPGGVAGGAPAAALVLPPAEDGPAAPFLAAAASAWPGLGKALNFATLFDARPAIDLARDGATLNALRLRAATARLQGGSDDWVSADELPGTLPEGAVADGLSGGVRGPGGVLRPAAAGWAYARAAAQAGVDVIEGARFLGLCIGDGRIEGVETSLGAARAPLVCACGDMAARRAARASGVTLSLGVRAAAMTITAPVAPTLFSAFRDAASGVAMAQAETGEIAIRSADGRIDPALALLPGLARLPIRHRARTEHPVAPDGGPLMGETPVRGLTINTGWAEETPVAAPAVGPALAALMAARTADDATAALGLEGRASLGAAA